MSKTPRGQNKVGAQVKENIIAVFNRLGGTDRMAAWAERNLTEFYRFYAKLVPTEVIGEFTIHDATELSDVELAAIATGGRAGVTQAPVGIPFIPDIH